MRHALPLLSIMLINCGNGLLEHSLRVCLRGNLVILVMINYERFSDGIWPNSTLGNTHSLTSQNLVLDPFQFLLESSADYLLR